MSAGDDAIQAAKTRGRWRQQPGAGFNANEIARLNLSNERLTKALKESEADKLLLEQKLRGLEWVLHSALGKALGIEDDEPHLAPNPPWYPSGRSDQNA